MPFAAYGQGPVLVTPFKMARVAATIAASGEMPEGRWVIDSSNCANRPATFNSRAGSGGFSGAGDAISGSGRNGSTSHER